MTYIINMSVTGQYISDYMMTDNYLLCTLPLESMPLDVLHRCPERGPIDQVMMIFIMRPIQMYILPGGREVRCTPSGRHLFDARNISRNHLF